MSEDETALQLSRVCARATEGATHENCTLIAKVGSVDRGRSAWVHDLANLCGEEVNCILDLPDDLLPVTGAAGFADEIRPGLRSLTHLLKLRDGALQTTRGWDASRLHRHKGMATPAFVLFLHIRPRLTGHVSRSRVDVTSFLRILHGSLVSSRLQGPDFSACQLGICLDGDVRSRFRLSTPRAGIPLDPALLLTAEGTLAPLGSLISDMSTFRSIPLIHGDVSRGPRSLPELPSRLVLRWPRAICYLNQFHVDSKPWYPPEWTISRFNSGKYGRLSSLKPPVNWDLTIAIST